MDRFEKNPDNYFENELNSETEKASSDEDFKNQGLEEKKKKKKTKGFLKSIAIALVLVIGCVGGGALVGGALPLAKLSVKNFVNASSQKEKSEKKAEKSEIEKAKDEKINEAATPLAYASKENVELIKRVKPSVVCITSTVEEKGFFNMTYESEGAGSGIIFSKNDKNIYIVTNCHVIEGAESVSISIEESEKTIPAELVGKNSVVDLAVISVSLESLKKNGIAIEDIQLAAFGNSDSVQVGSQAIAIGNALGEGNTATSGVVSAVNKEINISGKALSVIQTDSAINPGNSGGALINSRGEVIGINTAKISQESVEGVGYSITSNFAKPIIEKLMNNENAPYLGVYISDISDEIAEAYNLPKTGVIITQIIPNSSAAASDLRQSDIITGIDDKPIFNKEQLVEAISEYKIGDEIALKIIRNGKHSKTVKVKLIAGENSNF